MLIGAGAGLALAWLFRGRLGAMLDEPAEIVVEPGEGGRPRVTFVTPDGDRQEEQACAVATRESTLERTTCSSRSATGRTSSHQPAPPAVAADPDDHEHPPQNGLSRAVPASKRRPIRGKAQGAAGGAMSRTVKYAVYLDDQLAVDPIVKLIL